MIWVDKLRKYQSNLRKKTIVLKIYILKKMSGQDKKNNEKFDNLIFKTQRGTQDLSGQGEKI